MTRRLRVVLFNPQNATQPKPIMPLSLLSLGAMIDDVADWVLVDGNLENDPLGAVDRAIRENEAEILGMTVMPGPQLKQAVPLSRRIKERHPHVETVWGGYFPTQHWEVALRAPYVDAVVRGHGEVVFRHFLERRAQDEQVHELPGMAFRDSAGQPSSW